MQSLIRKFNFANLSVIIYVDNIKISVRIKRKKKQWYYYKFKPNRINEVKSGKVVEFCSHFMSVLNISMCMDTILETVTK